MPRNLASAAEVSDGYPDHSGKHADPETGAAVRSTGKTTVFPRAPAGSDIQDHGGKYWRSTQRIAADACRNYNRCVALRDVRVNRRYRLVLINTAVADDSVEMARTV